MEKHGHLRATLRRIAGPAALLVAVFASAYACILLTKEFNNPAAVWLADGIVIAVLLRQPRNRWRLFGGLGALGVAVANLAAGETAPMALGMAASNLLAMVACATLTARWVGQPRVDLTNPRHLPAFLLAGGVVAPVVASLAGVTWGNSGSARRLILHDGLVSAPPFHLGGAP